MKARDRKTGEIVEVASYGADGSYTVIRNGEGALVRLPVSFYSNYEAIIETKTAINWEQRRYEIAKDMLPHAAISVNAARRTWMNGMTFQQASAVLAIRYADALINELKNYETEMAKED